MKDLSNLSPMIGSNKTKKRVGRGIGSGLGKTAGKGHKGQKARKGRGPRPGFEGGQTPLYRRLPKFGFTNHENRIEFQIVNLGCLEKAFKDGDKVDFAALIERGLVRKSNLPAKILGSGSLSKKLNFASALRMSESAKESILKTGGAIEG